MSDLIDSGLRASLESAIADMHDTFARPIVVWTTPEEIYASTDPAFNPFLDREPATVTYVPKSTVIRARVLYNKAQELQKSSGGVESQQIRVKQDLGEVRIKIDIADYSIFENFEKIQFDGFTFDIDASPRPHGVFDPKYYTLFLKRSN